MDKCREEFEQYIRSQSGFTADFQIGCNGQYKSDLMHFMFVTWQHQQAKVEKLQKRVDACQNLLSKWKSAHLKGSSDYARGGFHARQDCEDELEQALKGEGNDA